MKFIGIILLSYIGYEVMIYYKVDDWINGFMVLFIYNNVSSFLKEIMK